MENSDNDQELNQLLIQKEKELKDIQNMKIHSLERKIEEKDKQFLEVNKEYEELQADFNYNLMVIKQREEELNEFYEKFEKFQELCAEKDEKIKELYDQVAISQQEADHIKQDKHDQLQDLYDKIEELKQQNKYFKNQMMQTEKAGKNELQHLEDNYQKIVSEKQQMEQNMAQAIEQSNKNIEIGYQKKITELQVILESFKQDKENSISQLKVQNDKLLSERIQIEQEISNLKTECFNTNAKLNEDYLQLKMKNKEIVMMNDTLEKQSEFIKNNFASFEQQLKLKMTDLQNQNEQLQEQMQQSKQKYKLKIQQLKSDSSKTLQSLTETNEQKAQKLEKLVKDYEIQQEKYIFSQRNLEEKLNYQEKQLNKSSVEKNELIEQIKKNFEQDLIKAKNQIDLKEHQVQQIQNEKNELNKGIEALKREFELIHQKNSELDKENQMLIQEVLEWRKRYPQFQNSSNVIKEKQNKKQQQQQTLEEQKDINNQQEEQSQIWSDDFGPATPIKVSFDNDPYQQNQTQNLKMSGSKIHNVSELKRVFMATKKENTSYKGTIETLTREMDQVQQKYSMLGQELQSSKDENFQLKQQLLETKEKIMHLNFEKNEIQLRLKQTSEFENNSLKLPILAKQIEEKQAEIQNLKGKLQQYIDEIAKLKKERLQLIDISNQLRAQLRRNEQMVKTINDQSMQVVQEESMKQKFNYDQKVNELENQVTILNQKLFSWQEVDNKKNMIIEKLQKSQYTTQLNTMKDYKQLKPENILDQQNQIEQMNEVKENLQQNQQKFTSLEGFKTRLNEIQQHLNQNFMHQTQNQIKAKAKKFKNQ